MTGKKGSARAPAVQVRQRSSMPEIEAYCLSWVCGPIFHNSVVELLTNQMIPGYPKFKAVFVAAYRKIVLAKHADSALLFMLPWLLINEMWSLIVCKQYHISKTAKFIVYLQTWHLLAPFTSPAALAQHSGPALTTLSRCHPTPHNMLCVLKYCILVCQTCTWWYSCELQLIDPWVHALSLTNHSLTCVTLPVHYTVHSRTNTCWKQAHD